MSVQSEINRINSAINSAYDAVSDRGGIVPASKKVANLATAIASIPEAGGNYNVISIDNGDGTQDIQITDAGGGSSVIAVPLSVTANGTYDAPRGNAYSPVTVNVPTGTARTSADLTASGATVTVPAGLYSTQATKSVASGSAGTPSARKGTVSNNSVTVTPSVTNTTGYIAGGTKTGTGVTVSASELVSGNKALTPSTTAQTNIDVKNYATASVSAITKELLASLDADFVAGNIKKDVDLFGLIGALESGGGGGSVPALSKGVNFIDYDGTVVATWETSTVASKTALPDNPSHNGLTSQGWNWSLADIKSYIATYPDALVTVGQMYTTYDGKTRIYIHLEDGRLKPYLGVCPNGSVEIDWGDGSVHNTLTGSSVSTVKTKQHTYASGGDYVISLTVTGSMGLLGASTYCSRLLGKNSTTANLNRVYQNAIQRVEIGSGITSIGDYSFDNCSSLQSITIPNSVTSIGASAFYNCYSLANISFPNRLTSIGVNAFYNCFSLATISFSNSVTSIGNYSFYACSSLKSVTIPNSVTSIGNYAFNSCSSLQSITIPNSVTSISTYLFASCNSLTHVTIPNSVTSIDANAFARCYKLKNVSISNGVSSIPTYAFYTCYCLANVIIPNSVTTIGSSAFYGCYGLGSIKFTSQTPPTVSNSDAWSSIPTDCTIYVPTGSLSAYKSATNYPKSSSYTYVEY